MHKSPQDGRCLKSVCGLSPCGLRSFFLLQRAACWANQKPRSLPLVCEISATNITSDSQHSAHNQPFNPLPAFRTRGLFSSSTSWPLTHLVVQRPGLSAVWIRDGALSAHSAATVQSRRSAIPMMIFAHVLFVQQSARSLRFLSSFRIRTLTLPYH